MEFEKRTFPNHRSHPVFLSTIGALLGLDIKPINICKVLELNCGDGGNIIPFSLYYPQMEYVGVDTDEAAVLKAKKLVKDLKLTNIKILKKELDELKNLEGQFDFIILNRCYSWINPDLRRIIWGFCQSHLSKNGIIFLNFNSLPGWAELLSLRRLIQFRIKGIDDLETAKSEIQKFLPAFSKMVTPPENIGKFSEFFKDEVNHILSLIDSDREQIFFEDFFKDENHPVYFSQLIQEAADFDFKFLSNCDLSNADRSDLPANVLQLLQNKSKDLPEFEQYIDFFVNQTFREILLCRNSLEINRTPDQHRLEKFFVKAKFEIDQDFENQESNNELLLLSESGMSVKVSGSLLGEVAAFLLENAASYIRIDQLFSEIGELAGNDGEKAAKRAELAMFLLSLYLNTDLLDMRVWEISEMDKEAETFSISPLIQIQAENEALVTIPEHYSVSLTTFERRLVQELPLQFTEKEFLTKVFDLFRNETVFKESLRENFDFDSLDEKSGKIVFQKMIKKGLIQTPAN